MEASGLCEFEWESDRFVFQPCMPRLFDMASIEVALKLVHHHISRLGYNNFMEISCDDLFSIVYESSELVDDLNLPRVVEEAIKEDLETIRLEMKNYAHHFSHVIFSENLSKYRVSYIDVKCLVWLYNGKIDYKKTISNILQGVKLSDVQKFVIMSVYCLVDEMTAIDFSSFPAEFFKQVYFVADFLPFYWICLKKNKLHRIPLGRFSSIDAAMAAKCTRYEWIAFKYFFDRLGVDDQVLVASTKLENKARGVYQFQTRLLIWMNEHQQIQLLTRIPIDIVLNFWFRLKMIEAAFKAWTLVKDRCTGDQFFELTMAVIASKMKSKHDMRLLIDIWKSASEDLRNHVSKTAEDGIISAFLGCDGLSPINFEFLYHFLSSRDAEFRKKVLLENKKRLIKNFASSLKMVDIIKLCLPNDDERLEFRRSLMDAFATQLHGVDLAKNNRFADLFLMLKIYSPDAESSREFVERLLKSGGIDKKMFILCHKSWLGLSGFIDRIGDPSWASSTKKQFISAFVVDCRYQWDNDNHLDEFKKVVEPLFTASEELENLKTALINALPKILSTPSYWMRFNETYFLRFLSWCMADQSKIDEFRNSLPIDDIFDRMLRIVSARYASMYRCSLVDDTSFREIDKCLKWYFGSDVEVKQYKIRRMYQLDDRLLDEIFQINDNTRMTKLAYNIFGNDDEEIHKFRLMKIARAEANKRV